MGQQGIQKLKCQKDDHQDEIDSVCYNQGCTKFRLNCFKCMKKGIHHTHLDDVEKINSLKDYIEMQNKECDNLINNLNKLVERVNQSYSQYKQGINRKYSLLKERLLQLNSQQINDFLNSTITFTEYKQSITTIISDKIKNLDDTFNNLYDQLQLLSFDYYQINDNEIKLSKQMCNQGINVAQEQKYDESIQLLDKSIQLDPNNQEALWRKGQCLRLLERYEDAITWLDKTLLVDPKLVKQCLTMLTRYEDAITWLDKALLIDPKDVDSLWNKGQCLRLLERYEDAITWLDKTLLVDPKHILSLCNKGECLRKLKRFDDSAKYIDLALHINPNDTFSLNQQGLLLEDQQKYENALTYYEKSLTLSPNNQQTIIRKQLCLTLLKQ
ncbi:unnamed protein product [Paramecium pentaurelia]|uniref:Tetratricopeptide repeat protein n=1 Tax=Paramecium pentaurelia TaxID=43138 RepID=A0A8S1YJZ1_9CILI|nr:unnamed protein product [Paramecium pentaurelia]